MSSSKPLVSIGLPVFNGERFLARAIQCVLAQSYQNWELVISDNASQDATGDICRHYAAQDARVRYDRGPENVGAVRNFNRVFALSRGTYFAWMAHDDLVAPQFVGQALARLVAEPDAVLAMPRVGVIDEDENLLVGDRDGGAGMSSGEILTDEVFPDRWGWLSSDRAARRYHGILVRSRRCYELFGLVRRDVLARTPLLRPFPNSEKVLLTELSLLGRFVFVPDVLFFSRWYPQRFTNSASAEIQNAHWRPRSRWRFVWPHQPRCAIAYALAPWRYPVPWLQRLACAAHFAGFLLQISRWPRILADAWRGAGMTVGIPARIQRTGVPRALHPQSETATRGGELQVSLVGPPGETPREIKELAG